jgi:hypothetical protein
MIDREAIRATLDQVANALTVGDAAGVARFWGVPGLVVGDEGARAVSSLLEVESFFQASIASYRERGTPVAKAELKRVDAISERVAAVDVIWHGLDAGGAVKRSETSHYIMRIDDGGIPRILVAMSRSV